MAYYMQKKSLAGKCGIPFERDQVDVRPVRNVHGCLEALEFEGGTRIEVKGERLEREFGREFFGNVCRHEVVGLPGASAGTLDVWVESGRWFVRRQDVEALRNPEN